MIRSAGLTPGGSPFLRRTAVKEKRYMNDWVNETRIDEKTGREKRVPVYRGTWYVSGCGPREKRRLLLAVSAAFVLQAALPIVYFLLDFPGARTLYVFLPLAFALFPALYWMTGLHCAFRAQQRMTRAEHERSFARMLRSSAACAVFDGAALVGETILLILSPPDLRELPGLVFPAVALCASVCAARVLRGAQPQPEP